MKRFQPYSPELRDLKAKAIMDLEKPLLLQLQDVDGEEFILVDSFLDLLMVTSWEKETTLVQTTSFKESFMKPLKDHRE